MPFEIKLLPDVPVMEIRIWDKLTIENVESMSNEVKTLVQASGVRRVLVDCRDYQGGVSLGDIYFHAKGIPERTADARRAQAFIAPANPVAAAEVQFYATAAGNQGTAVQIFSTRDAAIEWLKVAPTVRLDF
jgi:hypothetical protein